MSYADLRLTANPFVAEQTPGVPEHLYIEREVDPPSPGDRRMIQVTGPRGSGKTTLLLHWQRLQPGPYVHIAPGRRRWRAVPIAPIAYWDEADRIPRMIFRRALTAAAQAGSTIVIATHADRSLLGRRAGMTVQPVRLPAPTGPAVQVWAARRIAAAAQPGRVPAIAVDPALAEFVATDCDGSWRVVGDRLHSWAAAQAAAARQSDTR